MAGLWSSIVTKIFGPKHKAEKLKQENARIDKEIVSKKLEIKKLKKTLASKRKENFIKKLEKLPAQVVLVNIDGISRTSERLLMSKVKPLFETESFEDIVNTSKEVQNDLQCLGCFKRVDLTVDTVQGMDTQYRLDIYVEEAGSLFGNVGAVCDITNTVAGVVRAGLNNIGGGGEVGQVELCKGAGGYNLANIVLEKPLHWLPEGSNISVFSRRENLNMDHFNSSLTETVFGSSFSLSAFSEAFNFTSELDTSLMNTRHNFQHFGQHGLAAWDPLAEHTGHVLRSSLSTWLSLDLRDDDLLPAQGLLLAAGHKVSGNHRGQHAHQVTVSSSLHYPLYRGLSLSMRSLLSHTWGSYSPLPQELPYYKTGLLARGMTIPEDYQGDPTTFINILAVTSNLPLLTANSLLGRHVKFQTFLSTYSTTFNCIENIYLRNFSFSLGVGFVGKILDLGRFELNYCVPVDSFRGHGGNRPGLRFSFGTEFL